MTTFLHTFSHGGIFGGPCRGGRASPPPFTLCNPSTRIMSLPKPLLSKTSERQLPVLKSVAHPPPPSLCLCVLCTVYCACLQQSHMFHQRYLGGNLSWTGSTFISFFPALARVVSPGGKDAGRFFPGRGEWGGGGLGNLIFEVLTQENRSEQRLIIRSSSVVSTSDCHVNAIFCEGPGVDLLIPPSAQEILRGGRKNGGRKNGGKYKKRDHMWQKLSKEKQKKKSRGRDLKKQVLKQFSPFEYLHAPAFAKLRKKQSVRKRKQVKRLFLSKNYFLTIISTSHAAIVITTVGQGTAWVDGNIQQLFYDGRLYTSSNIGISSKSSSWNCQEFEIEQPLSGQAVQNLCPSTNPTCRYALFY